MAGGLVDTTEMYLKAIYEMEEEGVVPMRARLVERLGQSKPTVSETVARLERGKLLHVDAARVVRLTDKGRLSATSVMRKHRLAERLLLDVIGLSWPQVHNEACRWEHVMGDVVEERIASLLGDVDADPFGNVIPSCREAGPGLHAAEAAGLVSVAAFLEKNPEGGRCRLARIGESLQVDESLLAEFEAARMMPGAQMLVRSGDGVVTAETEGSLPVDLAPWMRVHLLVRA